MLIIKIYKLTIMLTIGFQFIPGTNPLQKRYNVKKFIFNIKNVICIAISYLNKSLISLNYI